MTDYPEGDVYLKIKHPVHNLDCRRAQMALVKSIEEQEDAMNALVRKVKP